MIAAIIILIIQLFTWLLLARVIIDFVMAVNKTWLPKRNTMVLIEIIFKITDPPLKLARKVIKPIQFGSISFDFSVFLIIILCGILITLIRIIF